MVKKYNIVGHANAALAIILDSLYSRYGSNVTVDIVTNISEAENDFADMPYLHPGIKTAEFDYTDWTRDDLHPYLLAGMSPKTKRIIYEFFKERFGIGLSYYEAIVHCNTTLCNAVTYGKGCNISPGTTVAPFTKLGDFVTLNRNVSIGHHTTIGDFASVNPGCHIAGLCRIGEGVQIGMGATVVDRIEIGENAVIGAGSLVNKPVPANTLVYGVPAKVVKQLD